MRPWSPPTTLSPANTGVAGQLNVLVAMRDRGELSGDEFAAAKRLLLGTGTSARPVETYTPSGFQVLTPPSAPPPGSSYGPRRARPAGVVVAFGGLGLIVGCLLPWAPVISSNGLHDSIRGIDVPGGDSLALFVAGAIMLLAGIGLTTARSVALSSLTLLLTACAGAVSIFDINLVRARSLEINETNGGVLTASVGAGLWVILVFAFVALVGIMSSYSD